MKKKIVITSVILALLGVIMTSHVQAATKTIKKTVTKHHTVARYVKAKVKMKTRVKMKTISKSKKKKVARVTHSFKTKTRKKTARINSPNAPLITQ